MTSNFASKTPDTSCWGVCVYAVAVNLRTVENYYSTHFECLSCYFHFLGANILITIFSIATAKNVSTSIKEHRVVLNPAMLEEESNTSIWDPRPLFEAIFCMKSPATGRGASCIKSFMGGKTRKQYPISYLKSSDHQFILPQSFHKWTPSVVHNKCIDCCQFGHDKCCRVQRVLVEMSIWDQRWVEGIEVAFREECNCHNTNEVDQELHRNRQKNLLA